MAARQELTREWWQHRDRFDLYASEVILQEAGAGNMDAAARRLDALRICVVLEVDANVAGLGRALLAAHALPEKARLDALHVATAAVHGMDYLLTWNCKHIANAATRGMIEETCRSAGFEPPIISTPEELMQE